MTTTFMTSDFRLRSHKRSTRVFLSNMFTVEVVDFDGESHEYSITAQNETAAAHKAENLAYSDGIQISYMNINVF